MNFQKSINLIFDSGSKLYENKINQILNITNDQQVS